MTEAEVANSVGLASQSRGTDRGTKISYGRWLREGDAEELVCAVSLRSCKQTSIKCDGRSSGWCWVISSQDCGSHGTDFNKRRPRRDHDRQGMICEFYGGALSFKCSESALSESLNE